MILRSRKRNTDTFESSLTTTPSTINQSQVNMAHENRIHQLENIANKSPQHEGKYDALAAGEMSVSSSQSGTTYLVPVPVTLKSQLGSPVQIPTNEWSLNHPADPRADCTGNWSILHDIDNACTFTDGIPGSHHNQRIHRQFPLCGRSESMDAPQRVL